MRAGYWAKGRAMGAVGRPVGGPEGPRYIPGRIGVRSASAGGQEPPPSRGTARRLEIRPFLTSGRRRRRRWPRWPWWWRLRLGGHAVLPCCLDATTPIASRHRTAAVPLYKSGATTHEVTLNPDGQLVLKPDNQPAYCLLPLQGRRFRIAELDGHSVEFGGDGFIDKVIFHQPNGTFAADRIEE